MSVGTAEYQTRIWKTKERMALKGIEVLLITDPANMNYLSGYDGWSFYVHQMLIVINDEDQPIWVGRTMDANAAKITTWLYHDNIISYPDTYVQSETKHPMDFVADILKQIGQDKRRIGVEMENYYFTAKCYEQLKKGLPNATFQDATLLVNWVRIVKSDQEIEYMKKAAVLAELAMNAGIEMINEGVRECDVAAKILYAQVTGTEEFGGDYPAIMPLMPSGEKTSTPHLTWTDTRYKANESVILELAGCYKRYHSPLARTIHIGSPSEELKKLAQVTVEGIEDCLSIIKPGIALEEVCETWTKSIAKYGYTKESRIGYSMGLNYPPDWGEHTASIRKGDRTILQPNMTFHMIPGMWYDKSGFEVSESFRITENGCETFANLPRGLYVKNEALIR
ncbi:Xaa-Pro dipeptidase [Planococcus halocryophilus Or1]|uniref:Ectoine hydrolase DoeA n=1 Tax=Planococcus halocryophilus TaxID=1215089 RepID=A0A1C7DVR0_9BACL|nr:M24 family metallopeptidase [Planococcus halocryophilus]ANU15388.1 ectoine hydrolase DoeA [Planococcus halocryophilus]EMF47753.1 Xaa-Pro dipeptidase [Planococcus halocryophilus Or1]